MVICTVEPTTVPVTLPLEIMSAHSPDSDVPDCERVRVKVITHEKGGVFEQVVTPHTPLTSTGVWAVGAVEAEHPAKSAADAILAANIRNEFRNRTL